PHPFHDLVRNGQQLTVHLEQHVANVQLVEHHNDVGKHYNNQNHIDCCSSSRTCAKYRQHQTADYCRKHRASRRHIHSVFHSDCAISVISEWLHYVRCQ